MKYRLLEPEEYGRLEFIFRPRGLPLPDAVIEQVGVVEKDGKIVAMAIRRLLPMIDGLWVEPVHRGGAVDYKRLAELVESPLREIPGSRCFAISTQSTTGKILAEAGYEEVKAAVYEKRF